MSGPCHPVTPPRWALFWLPMLLAIAGCVSVSPGSSPSFDGDGLHRQAQAALARWAEAVGDNKQDLVLVGELTGQIGDWEEPVGDNDKMALMAGQVRTDAHLATATPPPGTVRWPDGTSTAVDLSSADQALKQIAGSGGSACSDCRPLVVTAARLGSGPVETSRGPAMAPIWEFSVVGTNVLVTRVAVADPIAVVPPPWDPNDAPEGIPISSARGGADAVRLTVSFVGTPDAGGQPCGADYTAEAVESTRAVVVIVIEHRDPASGACSAVGAARTAVVTLASPLGDRAVLEVMQGLPVPVIAP